MGKLSAWEKSRIHQMAEAVATGQFVTVDTEPDLPASRRLQPVAGETVLSDSGAGGDITVGLAATAVTPGTYGDATHVAQVTVDAKGRVTTIVDVAITGASGSNVTEGTYAGRPGSPTDGDVYLVTDAPALLHRDSGAWSTWFGSQHCTPFTGSGFTWTNQGSATVTALGPYSVLNVPQVAGTNLRVYKKSAGGTPYTITAALVPTCLNDSANGLGLCFRESGSGKLETFGLHTDGSASYLAVFDWTDATTFSASVILSLVPTRQVMYLRMTDDGTNRVYSYSMDGQTYNLFTTVPRTTFLTADEFGIMCRTLPTVDAYMTVLSWVES